MNRKRYADLMDNMAWFHEVDPFASDPLNWSISTYPSSQQIVGAVGLHQVDDELGNSIDAYAAETKVLEAAEDRCYLELAQSRFCDAAAAGIFAEMHHLLDEGVNVSLPDPLSKVSISRTRSSYTIKLTQLVPSFVKATMDTAPLCKPCRTTCLLQMACRRACC